MVFSASAPIAERNTMTHTFIKKQLRFAVLGMVLMMVAANYDYHEYGRKIAIALMGFSILRLVLVLVPGIGVEINGSRRWIYVSSFQFQPSELAKLAIIIFYSYFLSKRKKPLDSFFRDLLPYLFVIGIISLLLLREPLAQLLCAVAGYDHLFAAEQNKAFIIGSSCMRRSCGGDHVPTI